MQLIKRKLPINHNLFLFGDDHEGTTLRHNNGWSQLVDMMNSSIDGLPESANFGVDHGDIIDAIMVDDKRYDGLTVEGMPLAQAHQAVRNRWDIKDKIVCILEGNHPLKLWRFGRLSEHICKELNIQYGTWSAKMTYTDNRGDVMYKHYATHGRKGINSTADDPRRRKANMELTLKRHLKYKAGDCVLMSKGHTHKMLLCSPESDLYLSDDGKKHQQNYTQADHVAEYIHPDLRWYVNTGSFYKLYGNNGISSYAEIAEYDPIECGFYICKVRDRTISSIEKMVVE